MEFSEIAAFVTVHRAGSFTRGADLLHVSQPAVSRRIELLERDLGAPLFERLTTGVRLTEAGFRFLPFAQQVLSAMADGRAAVQELSSGLTGTITLALTGTLAGTRVTDTLRRFRDARPEVRLLLQTGRSDEVSALVRDGKALIGLRYFEDARPEIASLCAAVEPLLVVASAASSWVPAQPDGPGALTGVPWVTYPVGAGSSGEPFAEMLERHLIKNGLEGSERVVIDSLTAQKRFIEADFGIGLLPESSIQEELRLGTLTVLPLPSLQASVPVMVIYRKQGYINLAGRQLVEMLTAN